MTSHAESPGPLPPSRFGEGFTVGGPKLKRIIRPPHSPPLSHRRPVFTTR